MFFGIFWDFSIKLNANERVAIIVSPSILLQEIIFRQSAG